MRGRILLGIGLAAGYVLGARAGRGAYERLRSRVDRVAHSPRVERAIGTLEGAAEQPPTARPAATIGEGTRATAPAVDDTTATATD